MVDHKLAEALVALRSLRDDIDNSYHNYEPFYPYGVAEKSCRAARWLDAMVPPTQGDLDAIAREYRERESWYERIALGRTETQERVTKKEDRKAKVT